MDKRTGKKPAKLVSTIAVKVLLAKRGWTMSRLAKEMDVYPGTVHRVVNNIRVGSRMRNKLADALGVPLSRLLINAPVVTEEQTAICSPSQPGSDTPRTAVNAAA